jgi:DNA polymerase-3 subunit epsilon
MSLLRWLRRPARTPLDAPLQARCNALAVGEVPGNQPLPQQRWVVLDLETTGLDMSRDLVLSIGAVVIEDGAIDFSQQFECTILREGHAASASTLIHGISPSAIAAGLPPQEALLQFMEFLGSSPLLAYHATFDQRMLSRALLDSLGYRLRHCFFDVAELAPLLCPQAELIRPGLDDWIRHFGLQVQQRHHASADALVTAELALILFSKARQQNITSLGELQQRLLGWRRRKAANF